jgi:hypothetical protein
VDQVTDQVTDRAVAEVERCDLGAVMQAVVIQVTQVVAVMQVVMQIIGQVVLVIQVMQVVQVTTGPEGAAAAAAAAEALTVPPDPLRLQEEPAQVLPQQQHQLLRRGAPTWIVH